MLALGHRHFYGLDSVPLDYDTAYGKLESTDENAFKDLFWLVYYQRMAFQARFEFYNPKPGEVRSSLSLN